MSPSTPVRVRKVPVPDEVISWLRSPRRSLRREDVAVASPAVRALRWAVVRFVHWKGMPCVPFQVSSARLVGPCAVTVVPPVAWHVPPVSTQCASQFAVLATLMLSVALSYSRLLAVSCPQWLVAW